MRAQAPWRSPTGARRGRRLAALAVAALIVCPLAGSAGASQQDPETLDDLIAAFDVADVPADFVVAVDVSRSMLDLQGGRVTPYTGVSQAYPQFVNSIQPGNRLAVVLFGAGPQLTFDAAITTANRAAALAAIPRNDPAAFVGPQHGSTDIGAALGEVLKRLETPDSSEVQTVVVLTDGRHRPPATSRYRGTSGPPWDALARRGKALSQSHVLDVYGAGLAGSGATDVGLVGRALPDPTILDVPPEQLGPLFANAVRRSQALKVRGPLQRELERGQVVVRLPDDARLSRDAEFDITVASTYSALPVDVTVEGVDVTVEGQQVRAQLVDGRQDLRLAPGESVQLTVRADLPTQESRFQVPAVEESAQVGVALSGRSQARPADLVKRLYQLDTAKEIGPATPTRFTRTVGYTWAQALTALLVSLVALLLLAILLRWLLVPPPLVGYLVVRDRPGGDQTPVRLSGRSTTIGPRQIPEAGGATLELFTRARKRNQVFAKPGKGEFEYQERGWRTVLAERRLSFAEVYRLGGCRFVLLPSKPGTD